MSRTVDKVSATRALDVSAALRLNSVLESLEDQQVSRVMGKPVTRRELRKAFSRVENSENWKAPIDKAVVIGTLEEQELIREAVVFFTGSVPTFTPTAYDYLVRVRATGYYAAVGA